jgi:general secretion pathway protein H
VRHQRGFTLVELLVVFAIMALLMGLVPVAFERLRESAEYRNTLRTMLAEMRGARARAMTEGVDTRFKVNLAQRSYGVDGQAMHTFSEPLQVRLTVAGTEMAAGQEGAIRFLSDGGATGGSVDVVRGSGAGVRLRVDWLSGRVTQEPLPP